MILPDKLAHYDVGGLAFLYRIFRLTDGGNLGTMIEVF